MFSVPLKCGNCRNLVDFYFDHVAEYSERPPEELSRLGAVGREMGVHATMRILNEKDKVSGSAHSQCPRCRHPSLIVFECNRVSLEAIAKIVKNRDGNLMGGPSVINVKAYFPEPKVADQSPFWPESLRRMFVDAQDMLAEKKSPAIILATARSVLELALKELDEQPKLSLYKRIEHLHEIGVITSAVRDWAHDIRLEGNDGTHAGLGDEASAAEYIEFLKLFLDMTFALPHRIAEKRQSSAPPKPAS
ncbi:MAG: DUF4145 domain-containing protein [Rhizobiales bacterium]|nr:DUF4145 domain-containing protein [Hyphomicrobiales bacterium]